MTRFEQIPPGGAASRTAPRCGSYSQWVHRVIRSVKSDRNLLISLFDSSVPEPVELVREVVLQGFEGAVTPRYTSAFADGNPFVVDALRQRYDLGQASILCTTGATGALSLIYRALLSPGDRILVETPCFDLFHTIAQSLDHPVDFVERRGDRFTIDPEEVAAAMTPRTRLIVLSNLHNPSGMALDEERLRAIARVAEAHGALLVVDEVYGDYAGQATRRWSATSLSPAILSVSSLTKTYGLSTLRCGWIAGTHEAMRPIRALNEEVEFGVSNLAHAMAALVLEGASRFDSYRDDILARARPIVDSYHAYWLRDGLIVGSLPDAGCIAFPRLAGIDDSEHFSEWLADRCGVVVAPGEYFGAPGHIRIGFARPPGDIDYGLGALTEGLQRYRDLGLGRKTR